MQRKFYKPPPRTTPEPLTKHELARHFLQHGRCLKDGKYCKITLCPLLTTCSKIDKLAWAHDYLKKSIGRCKSIW